MGNILTVFSKNILVFLNISSKIGSVRFMTLLSPVILHRTHLVEREKAERKADLLEKKLASGNTFIPCLHSEGQEHLLVRLILMILSQ